MHISVLLEECLKYLNLKEEDIVVDCTLGYGGHSSNILKRIKKGRQEESIMKWISMLLGVMMLFTSKYPQT